MQGLENVGSDRLTSKAVHSRAIMRYAACEKVGQDQRGMLGRRSENADNAFGAEWPRRKKPVLPFQHAYIQGPEGLTLKDQKAQ